MANLRCSLTGLLGPDEFQDIIDKDKEDKLEFIRTHPYLCDYDVKRNVKCTFRGRTEAGFKIHARSQHNWKPGMSLMHKYVDVAGISNRASAVAAAAAAPVAVASASSDLPPAPAVVGGDGGAVAAAKVVKQRICSACHQPGHQANSRKCSKKQKLELSSDDDGDAVVGVGKANE
jgi:hypothetical protein